MRRTSYAVICGMLLLLKGKTGFAQSADHPMMITASDFVMSQKDASAYSRDVFSPIVFDFVEKESGPEALRTRIRTFLEMIRKREIEYIALPAYYPVRSMHVLAKVERVDSKPAVILFVPEVQDWQAKLPPADFKNAILIVLAHEMIHLELGHEDQLSASDRDSAKNEAEAWAKTIVEIIRPLQTSGSPTSAYFADLSARFQRMNDNGSNPKWVKIFMR